MIRLQGSSLDLKSTDEKKKMIKTSVLLRFGASEGSPKEAQKKSHEAPKGLVL